MINFFITIALTLASASVFSAELFPEGKPIEFLPGESLESTATIGGYPIYPGAGWKIFKLSGGQSRALGLADSVNMGTAVLTQVEPDGNAFGVMFVTTNLSSTGANQYWTGAPCGGAHLVAVDKASGKNDNCMTIDVSNYQSGERSFTYFSVRSTHGASGGRRLVLEIRLNADMLGFRNTAPSNWGEEIVNASPAKKAFIARLRKWAEALQEASQRALDYSKPKDAYAAVPSYKTLLDVPPDLADGSFTQQFISAVEHERNAPKFRAIAYTKFGFQKVKWGFSDEKDSQFDADNRALEICNTGRPAASEPCKLYDLSNPATTLVLPKQNDSIGKASAVGGATDAKTKTAQERLGELKNLFDKGLITSKEFELKRSEIINGL